MGGSEREDSTSPLPNGAGQSKSEQEKKARIRDNQRRSRARRQEHLLDLERRLTESHSAFREAELQRAAFRDLQVENARLRDLLRIAGVNETLAQHYVNQGRGEAGQSQDQSTSLRHIRPRITLQEDDTNTAQARDGRSSEGSGLSLMPRTRRPDVSPDTINSSNASRHLSPSPVYPHAPSTLLQQRSASIFSHQHAQLQPSSNLALAPSPTTGGPLQPTFNPTPAPTSFCCESFHVPPNGALLETSENTILCSVAKDIIQQYNVNSIDMDWIKARLATGFCKPTFPGQGCRVNNQILFQVLNEISTQSEETGELP